MSIISKLAYPCVIISFIGKSNLIFALNDIPDSKFITKSNDTIVVICSSTISTSFNNFPLCSNSFSLDLYISPVLFTALKIIVPPWLDTFKLLKSDFISPTYSTLSFISYSS